MRRKIPLFLVAVLALGVSAAPAHAQIWKRLKQKVEKKIDTMTDAAMDSAVNKGAQAVTCAITNTQCIAAAQQSGKPVQITDANGRKVSSADSAQAMARAGGGAAGDAEPSFAAYQNYDFVPGDSVVFDDDFRSDDDGEFPAHWKLTDGQGVVNLMNGKPVFVLTDGLDAVVSPRIKTDSYLGDAFTVEFDFNPMPDAWDGINLFVRETSGQATAGQIDFKADGTVSTWGFPGSELSLSAPYPGGSDNFANHWHHAAVVYRNGQLKAYLDQYRVLVVPDFPVKPIGFDFGGRADPKDPIRFTNVRIANGGGMKMINELTRAGRIITHGIRFDVDKAVVKPESMGTIRQIVAMMKQDPSVKFEIGGHTDSDGDAAHNLTLSQQRADAVKAVLVQQGIEASRLTTKGYGATKPIASNDTPEGKATNRRVEFVKQ
ncbi:MAG: OmpA family protein [Gemmatimonadota bacterium]|nr:OmpA family protein [Gemmatimonadota bacterium]HEU4988794.1 OmpA family protein [Gemmatimonadaceae bacterium]